MNPIVIRVAVRGLLAAVVALLALFAQGCVPSTAPPKALPEAAVTRAVDVLEGVQTLAGSRELVANAARWMRVPDAWLRTPAACAVAELLSQGAAAAIPSLEASTPGRPPSRRSRRPAR